MPGDLVWTQDLSAHSSAQIESLLRATGVFSEEEITIGSEMAAEARAHPAQQDYFFLFAYDGDALAGYSCYGPVSFTDNRYDLYWIAVDPARGRGGLGGEILRRTESLVAVYGGKILYAETSGLESYEAARSFYLRQGYRLAARLSDFYATGNDKFIFEKRLG